jgi:hypothetical protein
MDDTAQDYFARHLKEGAQSPDEAGFDQELKDLLAKLYDRQRDEAHELYLQHQHDVLYAYGTPDHPYMVKDHNADNAAQEQRFTAERERYIRDYQQTAELRREMNEKPSLSIDNKLTR